MGTTLDGDDGHVNQHNERNLQCYSLMAHGTLCGFIHWFPRIILVQNWKWQGLEGCTGSQFHPYIYFVSQSWVNEYFYHSSRQLSMTHCVYIDENWRIKNKSTLQWQFSEPRQIVIILGKHLILMVIVGAQLHISEFLILDVWFFLAAHILPPKSFARVTIHLHNIYKASRYLTSIDALERDPLLTLLENIHISYNICIRISIPTCITKKVKKQRLYP